MGVLEDLAHRVRQLSVELNRPLLLIAESDTNDPRLVRPAAQGGLQLDAHWVDDFHHSLHRFFTAPLAETEHVELRIDGGNTPPPAHLVLPFES